MKNVNEVYVKTLVRGRDGVGISGCYINNGGELVVKYTNGKEENVGYVGNDVSDEVLEKTLQEYIAAHPEMVVSVPEITENDGTTVLDGLTDEGQYVYINSVGARCTLFVTSYTVQVSEDFTAKAVTQTLIRPNELETATVPGIYFRNGFDIGSGFEWETDFKEVAYKEDLPEDCVSPEVAVEEIVGGHRITIADESGIKSFDVMDGQDGEDGISPTVTVTDITGGHRVTINAASGSKSFDVMDGQDGENGSSISTVYTSEDYGKFLQVNTETEEGYEVAPVDILGSHFSVGSEGLDLAPITGLMWFAKHVKNASLLNNFIIDVTADSYGVKGDGENDDGAGIQNVLDICEDVGCTIYFPPGTYCVSKTLFFYSNMRLLFAPGATLKRIKNADIESDTCGVFLCNKFATSDTTDGTIACENVEIIGATFDMDSSITVSVAPVNTCHAKNIRIRDCKFINNYNAHCIEINSSDDVYIEQCSFSDYSCSSEQIAYNEMIQIDKAVNGALGTKFDGNSDRSIRGYNYETKIDSSAPDCKGSSNINIYNCTFNCNAGCAAIGNHHVSDFTTINEKIRIHGNVFNGGASTRGYIVFDEYTHDVDIYDNTFISGIIGVTANAENANFTVHDNRFESCADAYLGNVTAYCNLIDGTLDASADDAYTIIAQMTSDGTVSADISNFVEDTSSPQGSYEKFSQYYIYKIGSNRIKGYIEFTNVKTVSSSLFRPFAVKSSYRSALTGNMILSGDVYHSSMFKPLTGYIVCSSGDFTVSTGVNASSSAVSKIRINFDYFIKP